MLKIELFVIICIVLFLFNNDNNTIEIFPQSGQPSGQLIDNTGQKSNIDDISQGRMG
ncbi:MAG: hypothetical protein ACPKPY_08100 [Nitrososphaeraceae archaeon]